MKLEELPKYTKDLDSKHLIVTSVTKQFAPLAHNWYQSGKNIGIEKPMCIFALDDDAHDYLEKNNIPVFRWDNKEPEPNTNRGEWIELEKKYKFKIPITVGLTTLSERFDVVVSDVDIVFLKPPFEKISAEIQNHDFCCITDKRFDIFNTKRQKNKMVTVENKKTVKDWGLTDQSLYGEINGAFGYFPVNDRTIPFLNKLQDPEILAKFPKKVEAGAAQTIFNIMLKELKYTTKILDPFEFPNGSIWGVPYLKKEIKNSCYLIHYNFISKDFDYELFPEKKIALMKSDNLWFLDK